MQTGVGREVGRGHTLSTGTWHAWVVVKVARIVAQKHNPDSPSQEMALPDPAGSPL